MSKSFNLLLLHSKTDIHPRTWICLKGIRLKFVFKKLEEEVREKTKLTLNELNEYVSKKLNCSHRVTEKILKRETKFFPIPVIIELLKLSKNKKILETEINKNTKYLKVNSASAKTIKAVKDLNKNLAKIIGAFMADGSLSIQKVVESKNKTALENLEDKLRYYKINYSINFSKSRNQHYISIQLNRKNLKIIDKLMTKLGLKTQTHFNIELTDEYKDSVEAFNRWILKEFDMKPNNFSIKKNAWRTIFSNKIMARYLMKFFKITPGPKTFTAFEPKVIKNSNLYLRKFFAKGVLMFDGCITKNSQINFMTVSKKLFNSIKEIWTKDKIKFWHSFSKRKEWSLGTLRNEKIDKLNSYFEKGTQKEKLLSWLNGDLSVRPVIKEGHSVSIKKMLKIIRKVGKCDAGFLEKYFKSSHSNIRNYLKILKKQNKIKLSNKPVGLTKYVDGKTTVFLSTQTHNFIFQKMIFKFKLYENFAKFTEINKATLSSWKLKKNRIPLHILKESSKILDINFNRILNNVIQTDREIAEII